MQDHGHYDIPLLGKRSGVIGFIANGSPMLRSEINRVRLHEAPLEILRKLLAASEYRNNETGEHLKQLRL